MYEAKENEKLFGIRPIGVKYVCPFCKEGEMKLNTNAPITMPKMFPHTCTKCGKDLLLDKTYPYVEFDEITDDETRNDLVDAVKQVMATVGIMMKEKEEREANRIHMEDENARIERSSI